MVSASHLNERRVVDADMGVGVLDTEGFVPVITFALAAAWDKYLSAAYQNGKMLCG